MKKGSSKSVSKSKKSNTVKAKSSKTTKTGYNRNDIIITIIVLLVATVIGIFLGKLLYEAVYGPI